MFPLDVMAADAAGQRIAGRFGVDVICLLRPVSATAGDGVALVPLSALGRPAGIETLVSGGGTRLSRALLRDHALVLRTRGGFLSTDQVAVARIDAPSDHWSMTVEITHLENRNLEPAPRDLYLIIAFESGDRSPGSIALQFAGRHRDVAGTESSLADPVAAPLAIQLP